MEDRNMKKKYINPLVIVSNLSIECALLDASPDAPGVNNDATYNGDGTNLTKDGAWGDIW